MKTRHTLASSLAVSEHWQQRFYRIVQLRYIVWVLLFALSFIAWNRGLALLYGVVAMLLATFTLSAVLPWLYLNRIGVRFFTIPPVHAGSQQTISLSLLANKTLYGVALQLPWALKPTEDNPTQLIAHIAGLKAQMNASRVEFTVPTAQRGHLQLDHINAQCAYPFGLFVCRKKIATTVATRTVYPRLINIRALPSLWLNGANQCDDHPRQQHSGHDLFLGLRDYRAGDHYRRIDWRASARSGDIKVREYEQLEQPSLLLIINNASTFNVGDGHRNTLEHSLSLAASLADYALRHGFHTVIAGALTGKVTSSHQLTDFYQQLAELAPQTQSPGHYHQIVQQALAENSRTSIAISFSCEAITSNPMQQQKHWQCIFDSESYLKPLMRTRAKAVSLQGNHVFIPIRASDKLEQLFNDSH